MADECRAPRDGAPGSVVRGFVASNHPMGLPVPVGAAVGPAAYAAPPNYNVVYNPPGPEHTGVGYPRFPLSNAAAPATYEHVTHDLGVFDRSMTPTAQQYTTNLFDCTGDMETCCYGTFCTVCQVGEAVESAQAGDCCTTSWLLVLLSQANQLMPCLGSVMAGGYLAMVTNRAALNYGINERTDLATACLCAPCVSCRLAREVKNRAAMGQEPNPLAGMYAHRGAHAGMFPPAIPTAMVRTAAPPVDHGNSSDTMVTYVAVTEPRDYHVPVAQQQQQHTEAAVAPGSKL